MELVSVPLATSVRDAKSPVMMDGSARNVLTRVRVRMGPNVRQKLDNAFVSPVGRVNSAIDPVTRDITERTAKRSACA